jgi:hypothetical protein
MTTTHFGQDRPGFWKTSTSTRLFVVIQGILLGLVGMVHGIAETLQGNTPTGGVLLGSIGAFTLLPTYLISGIAAIIVSCSLIVWTVGCIQKKNGPRIFLLLSLLLFCVGGGIAQVLFMLITWGASTRINNPGTWWSNVLPEQGRKRLAQLWAALLIIDYAFLLLGIGIWLFVTPPGTPHQAPTIVYALCWSSLSVGLVLQMVTVLAGLARDGERQASVGSRHG